MWCPDEARLPAPAFAVRARYSFPLLAERCDQRARCGSVFAMLFGLGRKPPRQPPGDRCDRWQNLASCPWPRLSRTAHRLGLGITPAPRAWPAGHAEKSNEITAIPLPLERLQLSGALVNTTPTRPSKPIMAASRPAAIASPMTWPGLPRTTVSPASRAFPASRPSPWSRPSPRTKPRAPLPRQGVTISPQWRLIRPSSPRPFAPIGASKTASTECSTPSSTTISCA